MPANQKMKQLYPLKIGNAKIIVRCAYSPLTNKITIQTIKEYDKHYTYSKTDSKIVPLYKVKKNASACDILKQHSDELKEDPNKLSTAFLQKMIGVKCK